jgi:hypothetical protein
MHWIREGFPRDASPRRMEERERERDDGCIPKEAQPG